MKPRELLVNGALLGATAAIDPSRFATFAPHALSGAFTALQAAATKYGIVHPLALAHWLGQMSVESGKFSRMSESLDYSKDALLAKFGRNRISKSDAEKYGRTDTHPSDQRALANILYGGEFGKKQLGNSQEGDGWLYRGGGFKQITGRDNYIEAGHEGDPDTLRTDVQASANAAANFFIKHGCLTPALQDDVRGVTNIVNHGTDSLFDRFVATEEAKEIVRLN